VVAVIVGGILINLLWLLGSLIRIGGRIFDGIGGLVFAIGFLLAYVVWTIGFGGALASRFGSRLPAPNGLTAPATVQTAPPPPAPPGSQIQPPVST
jgi:Na+-transporting methylmalonyl-CoA/oxaloacetate decarboxylase gamma subunit